MIKEPQPPNNATLVDHTPSLANACSKWRKEERRELITRMYGKKVLLIWPDTLNVEDQTGRK